MNRKVKYIIYTHNAGYVKVCLSDVFSNDNVVVYEYEKLQKFIIKLTYCLYRIFKKSKSINKIFFPLFINKKSINLDEIPVFIFYEFNSISCNKAFLIYLKKLYPNLKTVLYLTNSVGKGNAKVVDIINQNNSLYDIIITYIKEDAQKYNITYYQWFYSAMNKENVDGKEYDLYFLGGDKGRIDLIREIAEKCECNNLKYKIAVVGANNNNIDDCVTYLSHSVPYSEYLQNIQKSKCVLELVPNSILSCTLRTAEAIACNVKLLTNNTNLKNDEIYNPAQMSIFTSVDDIDMDFIIKDTGIQLFNKPDMLSPRHFFRFLENNLFEHANRFRK
ncbi:hypothetical protein FACS189415_4320 [Bacteroidia bacterium]|nr:hypothetical protein FACS189426_21510 [Bacteroidia bacterium]GHT85934.1 hypothetical protein FACS18947_5290 [Bacteroidia bacterium]GHU82957.1 hypothetical protein FACS189415_4320 [Bacteroidia bacterium]